MFCTVIGETPIAIWYEPVFRPVIIVSIAEDNKITKASTVEKLFTVVKMIKVQTPSKFSPCGSPRVMLPPPIA